jgi:hypothetical protein
VRFYWTGCADCSCERTSPSFCWIKGRDSSCWLISKRLRLQAGSPQLEDFQDGVLTLGPSSKDEDTFKPHITPIHALHTCSKHVPRKGNHVSHFPFLPHSQNSKSPSSPFLAPAQQTMPSIDLLSHQPDPMFPYPAEQPARPATSKTNITSSFKRGYILLYRGRRDR